MKAPVIITSGVNHLGILSYLLHLSYYLVMYQKEERCLLEIHSSFRVFNAPHPPIQVPSEIKTKKDIAWTVVGRDRERGMLCAWLSLHYICGRNLCIKSGSLKGALPTSLDKHIQESFTLIVKKK